MILYNSTPSHIEDDDGGDDYRSIEKDRNFDREDSEFVNVNDTGVEYGGNNNFFVDCW